MHNSTIDESICLIRGGLGITYALVLSYVAVAGLCMLIGAWVGCYRSKQRLLEELLLESDGKEKVMSDEEVGKEARRVWGKEYNSPVAVLKRQLRGSEVQSTTPDDDPYGIKEFWTLVKTGKIKEALRFHPDLLE